MAKIAIAATVAPNSFLSIRIPPLLDGWADGTRMSVPPTPADPIEKNRENDDDADEQPLPVAVDAGHEQAVADDLDQGGTDERAEGAALATQQVGAADHRGGDHAQFIAGPQRIDRRTLPSHDHDRRDRGRQRADDVGLQLDAVDRHARQPRRLLVAADGKEVAAPGGESEHEPEGDREDQQQP